MKLQRLSIFGLLIGLFILSPAQAGLDSKAVQQFAQEMQQKHGFKAAEIVTLLNKSEFQNKIIEAISRPAESKAWHEYRPIFLQHSRIQGGVEFWRENEALLKQIEADYGVPAEILVAIVGVETRYGRHTGTYRVIDALATLAFGYPPRAKFFRDELEQFLLLAREEHLEVNKVTGSYAGAMGMGQFIASSYRQYTVDYDGDKQRDLWSSKADALASVANYFKRHGWKTGEEITLQVTGGDNLEPFVAAGMKPSIPAKTLLDAGLQPLNMSELDPEALCSLIELDSGVGMEYWIGLNNFYVITRYNHSNLYAMAVYQLSQAILNAKQQPVE